MTSWRPSVPISRSAGAVGSALRVVLPELGAGVPVCCTCSDTGYMRMFRQVRSCSGYVSSSPLHHATSNPNGCAVAWLSAHSSFSGSSEFPGNWSGPLCWHGSSTPCAGCMASTRNNQQDTKRSLLVDRGYRGSQVLSELSRAAKATKDQAAHYQMRHGGACSDPLALCLAQVSPSQGIVSYDLRVAQIHLLAALAGIRTGIGRVWLWVGNPRVTQVEGSPAIYKNA